MLKLSATVGVTNPFHGINLDSFDAGAALFAGEFEAMSFAAPLVQPLALCLVTLRACLRKPHV